ncbi:MAG: IS6 family transposase [Dehalococcoidales bacterium]|nr:IS6 family transposase [Dehalococcoidales bacterium]
MPACKLCQSDNVIKYGSYKGVQRYYCKDCHSKFKADDTLFYMKTPANQVSSALNSYYEGMSIKAIRRHLQQEHANMPSTATIYEWVQKYTQYATDSIEGYQPKQVGDTWIADETVLEIDGQNVWLWDIIDDKTRYLLATRISTSRTTRDAQMLIDRAVKTAGKYPKVVITDKLPSYLDVRYGKDTEHIQGRPFAVLNNTQKIERFHSTLKQRTKVMRGLKNIESAHDFVNGWLVHYNYLRPHTALADKTPAEVAGVDFPYKNWADITRHKPSKPIITSHVKRGTMRMEKTHIGRPRKLIPRQPRPPRESSSVKDKFTGRRL